LSPSGWLISRVCLWPWNDALNRTLDRLRGQRLSALQSTFLSPQANPSPVPADPHDSSSVARSGGLFGDQAIHDAALSRYFAGC
jgi:hypothetical protein